MTSIKPLFISLLGILSALAAAAPTFAQNSALMLPVSDQVDQRVNAPVDVAPEVDGQTESVRQPTVQSETARPSATIDMEPQECETRCHFINGVITKCYQVCF